MGVDVKYVADKLSHHRTGGDSSLTPISASKEHSQCNSLTVEAKE